MYQLTKECFGEDIALQQEKEAMEHGEYCARRAQGKDPEESTSPINKVSVLGSSRDTPSRLYICEYPWRLEARKLYN